MKVTMSLAGDGLRARLQTVPRRRATVPRRGDRPPEAGAAQEASRRFTWKRIPTLHATAFAELAGEATAGR